MALNGSFYNYPVSQFGLYCEWSGRQSQSGNYTDVTLNVYLRFYSLEVGQRTDSVISINGDSETYTAPRIYDYSTNAWHNVLLKSKTIRVVHNADGSKNNVSLSASWRFSGNYSGVNIGTITASTTVNLDKITTYSLSISAGTGSNITVNRTSSSYAGTGNLSNGARLYYNDKLKITFTPSTNYAISAHTVNGSTFTSGNTHTVTGNVSVAATAQVLASIVGATDANIGSSSSVVVTKYNSSYYHSLQYKFGSLSGYITSGGGTQSTEVKFSNTSVAFKIPTSFYAEIPNAKTGKCTITCRTYSSSGSTSVLGNATTCTITLTATGTPNVSGTVVDTNATTVALTGSNSRLIRYKSTATATISATAKNSSSIVSKFINGSTVSGNTKVYNNCSETSFVFKAVDSRGYSTSVTKTPTVVAYIQLTINPVLLRPSPTGSNITMSFSGDFYRGSFGAATNTLTIRYRYKESGGSYGAWKTVESTKIVFGSRSYTSSETFALNDEFNYQKEYQFQVQAIDGTTDHPLSTVTKNITVPRGIPVFDWGENDFNFNVPVRINEVTIADFIIDQGTIGEWIYRKWNSGIAECWSQKLFQNIPCKNQWGNTYTSGTLAGSNITYPFSFITIPVLSVTIRSKSVGCWVQAPGSELGIGTQTSTGGFEIGRGSPYESCTFMLSYYALGRWKL